METSTESTSQSTETYSEWKVLSITVLTSIATIIGSGILALPVTLHETSLPLFLILFTLVFIAIIFVIYAAVDIMHITYYTKEPEKSVESIPLISSSSTSSPTTTTTTTKDVSLFEMATRFIPNPFIRFIFHISTLISFLSLLVSYGLAGPQALYQLITGSSNSPPILLNFMYSTIGTLLVLFFVNALLPFFSSLTIVKGGLFIGVVIIVAIFLPSSIKINSISDLLITELSINKQCIVPFLMACVAIGALPNTMPITFKLIQDKQNKQQIINYRNSVILGLFICYILNIGWIIAILQIVPRDKLSDAFNKGLISTIPLVDTLSTFNSRSTSASTNQTISTSTLNAITITVNLFILTSAVVSFFIMAAGCKNYIDGGITYFFRNNDSIVNNFIGYSCTFGFMILTIVWNPDGFIKVLTNITSFTMNLQSGTLIFVMLYYSKKFLKDYNITNTSDDVENSNGNGNDNKFYGLINDSVAKCMIYVGFTLFSLACLLVLIAPLIGVRVSGPSE